jgi:hypothetical protein
MFLLKTLLFTLSGIGGISCLIFRKRLPPVFFWLGIFMLFALASQLGAILLGLYRGNNVEYYNVVMAINFILLYIIFERLSQDSYYRNRIHIVFTIGAVFVIYLLIPAFLVSFATRALTVLNIVIVIYSLLYLYQMLRVPSVQSVYQRGKFWIAAGFLIHHISIFSFWLTYEYTSFLENRDWINPMTYSLTIMHYILLIIAVFIQLKYSTND